MITMLSPYPGLRPFQLEEHELFFGREEQVDELLRRLRDTRFLAVVGPSGCGKSSLVRAGMMAALEAGYLVTAGSSWRFAVMRPGGRPIQRLAEALIVGAGLAPASLDAALAREFIEDTLRRGPCGLVEVLEGTPLPEETNLLVLVDQFEEIFRFRREGDLDEANAFVALLLESARQQEQPVYVVITMRSDFFGDCAVFTGLPEVINRSQYLTPRLSREQREAAIVGPARVFGGNVEPKVVNRLLNDMGSDPDQLPVLQHLLMRMWTWRGDAAASCADERLAPAGEALSVARDEGARTLTMEDYESVGGFANALSNHAEEAFARLSERQQRIAEIMFRRLSERGPDKRDIRRPTPAGEIAALAGVGVDDVVQVADVFRAPGCSFMVPPCPEPISSRTVLDISHESFLRQWWRLRNWIDAEAKSVESYRFLEETARHWRQGRAALWGTPNLELALAWREEERPTAEWASRYGGDFATAMEFLAASETAKQAELARNEAARRASVRRLRWTAAGFAALSLLLAGGFGYIWNEYWREHVAYYNAFIKKEGIAEGYGELTDTQRRARQVSLKVVREGRFGPVLTMAAVDAGDSGKCSPNHTIGTLLEFNVSDSVTHRECRWEFVRDSDGDIVYELAYNQFDKLVWGLAYTPKAAALGDRRRAYFVNSQGAAAPLKNSQADIIEFAYTAEGYEKQLSYFGRDGSPQPGPDLAYSRRISYTPEGLPVELVSLDRNGNPMNDQAGNASMRMEYDQLGNVLSAEAFDKNGDKITTTAGFHRFEATYDSAGNQTEFRVFNALGGRALCSGASPFCGVSAYRIVNKYNDQGFLEEQSYYGTSNEPIAPQEYGYHQARHFAFNKHGYPTEIRYYDITREEGTDLIGCHLYTIVYSNLGQPQESRCFGVDQQPVKSNFNFHRLLNEYDHETGNVVSHRYYSIDDLPVLHKDGNHRMDFKHDVRGNVIEITYFDEQNRRIDAAGGYHRSTISYNLLGQEVERRFFKADGQRAIAGPGGYHRETRVYDDRGHAIEFAYFGPEDQPVLMNAQYHKMAIKRDEQGRALETAYYDEKGALMMQPEGFAVVNKEYDIRGNVIKEVHLGTQLEPLMRDDGCTVHHAEYDDQNRLIMAACYDSSDQLVLNKAGFAKLTNKYDANGNVIEEAYYGTDGNLLLQPQGYAILRAKYNERGLIYLGFFDAEGKPARIHQNDGPQFGHSEQRNEYRQDGRLAAQRYSGFEPGRGYAEMVISFDEQGMPVETSYFDVEGQPVQTEVVVTWIEPGGRAGTKGISVGDVLLQYNGEAVLDFVRFIRQRELEPANGPDGKLSVRRGEEILTFSIPPGKVGMGLQGRGIHARAPGAVTAGARPVVPTSP